MASPSAGIPSRYVDRSWTLPQRIGFRLIFCYFALYLVLCWLVDQLGILADEGVLPGAGLIVKGYGKLLAPVVSWTGRHLLHISRKIVFAPATNSDGIYGYTLV